MLKPSTVIALAAAAGLTIGLAGCGEQPEAKSAVAGAARPVLVETVKFEPLSPERTFVATIRPRIESDLGFRVSGKVDRRLVDIGDRVTSGQILAVLDETDLRLSLEQAQAELRAARDADVSAAAELERRAILSAKGFVTVTSLDQQRTIAADARARKTKAERALALAENQLGYAQLIADADGVVTARLIEPGQVVSAGQTAIRVARSDEREALVAIPEQFVERLKSSVATVTLWSNPDRLYKAELRELSPAADPATRTYAARFALPGAGPEVVLGMTATVIVREATDAKVARLPLSALFAEGSGPALWVADRATGALTLKPVTVAKYDSASVYVASGVANGDEVVTLGVQKLDAGQKVRIVTALGR